MWKTATLRRLHRRLGLFIGIQVLLWVSTGIYFAWTDIDEIHGDHLRGPASQIDFDENWISPSRAATTLGPAYRNLAGLELVRIAGSTFYQLHSAQEPGRMALVDVHTGVVRPPLDRNEAMDLAREHFVPDGRIVNAVLLESADVGAHHEYRGGSLPAWRVEFDHPSKVHVYVSAEGGEVTKFRTRKWRIFDFLWMLHTMDYLGRDDINNPLLRSASLLALLLVITGFWLWRRTHRPRSRG